MFEGLLLYSIVTHRTFFRIAGLLWLLLALAIAGDFFELAVGNTPGIRTGNSLVFHGFREKC